MDFINPLFLIGISSAFIPLLIHLLSKRHAKVTDFSSLQFLLPTIRKRMTRFKIKQVLLLITRTLIIILLVLAFSRPTILNEWAVAGERMKSSIVIILDNSYSMSYKGVGGRYFDIAKGQALKILDSLRTGDDAEIILMSDHPEVLFPNLTTDIQQLKLSIINSEVSDKTTSLLPSISRAVEVLAQSSNPLKRIYLISDLKAHILSNWNYPLKIPKDIKISVIKIGSPDHENSYIEDIMIGQEPMSLEPHLIGVHMPTQIVAKINGHSKVASDLIIDKTLKAQTIATSSAIYDYTFERSGLNVGEIRLATDNLDIDNKRFFVVNVLGNIKALVVSNNLYLDVALMAKGDHGQEPIIVTDKCSAERLADLPLSEYDIVIIDDVPRLSNDVLNKLMNFHQNGGNMLVFIGRSADPDWYNSNFRVLPALLTKEHKANLKLGKFDSSHPIFRMFNDGNIQDQLNSIEFYSVSNLTLKHGYRVISSFNDGTPAMIEMTSTAGRGKILLLNTSPNPSISDLPLKPAFLPILYQTILYLNADADVMSRNILVGDTYTKTIYTKLDAPPDVLDPRGNINKAEVIDFVGYTQIRYRVTDYAGIYKLTYVSNGKRHTEYFAVNLNTTKESDLSPIDMNDLKEKLGEGINVTDTFVPNENIEPVNVGVEISSRLLILALALMILEIPLANRYKKIEREKR